jgi:PAS domain S-box-containing protein
MHSVLLKKLFGDRIEVSTYSYDVDSINSVIDADLFVFSLYSIYVTVKKYIPAKSQVVIINTTINVQQYNRIMEIPDGQKVMVVNYSSEMTMETIALFNQLGINHSEFYPFYPEMTNIPELGIAITPGEAQYVPRFVKKVIDIDNRIMDTATIIDITGKLNMDHLLQEEHFIDYFNTLKTYRSGLQALLGRTNTLESEMESLLNVLDDGIIGIDSIGLIYAFNKRAESITGYWKDAVIGKRVSDILPEIPYSKVIESAEPIKAMLIKLNDKDISTTIVPVIVLRKVTGVLAIINEFTEQERNQHKLRLQLLGKKMIELQDTTFARYGYEGEFKLYEEEAELAAKLIRAARYGKEKYLFVLECLEKSRKNRSRIGRRSLVELASERDLFISENEVRGILNILNDYGMVNLSNGRGGTQITELGIKIYKYIKAGLNE